MACRCGCHIEAGAGRTNDPYVLSSSDELVYYEAGAGVVISDADYAAAPANGTLAVTHNTSNGKSYLWARANGTWKSVEIT